MDSCDDITIVKITEKNNKLYINWFSDEAIDGDWIGNDVDFLEWLNEQGSNVKDFKWSTALTDEDTYETECPNCGRLIDNVLLVEENGVKGCSSCLWDI